MANKRGLFDSADYESGIKKLDVRDMIFELQPLATPFITILSKMNKMKAVDTEFTWFEDDLIGNYTQLNMVGNAAAGVTQLILDDADIFQEADVIKVLATDEVLLVVSVDSTTQITVKRGWGTTSAAQIDDNAYLYKLGSAMPEGYTSPESLVTAKSKKSNFLQIFSKTITITGTAEQIATYGGNRRNFERNKKAVELKREMEAQFLWGEKKEDTTGAHPKRQTAGIYSLLGANAPVLDMSSAALTESAFEGWLKDVFAYSEDDRYFFTSSLVISQISQFAAGKQRVDPGTTIKYGVKVKTYHSANGDVHLVKDRHFSGPNAGKGIALDIKQLVYRYLQNRDFTLELNKQNKKDDYKLDEYMAEIGLELHQAKLHGIAKGIV